MPQITSAPQLMDLCQKQPELCNAIKSDSNTTIIVINQESSLAKDVADVKKPIDKGLVPSGKGLLIGGGTGAVRCLDRYSVWVSVGSASSSRMTIHHSTP